MSVELQPLQPPEGQEQEGRQDQQIPAAKQKKVIRFIAMIVLTIAVIGIFAAFSAKWETNGSEGKRRSRRSCQSVLERESVINVTIVYPQGNSKFRKWAMEAPKAFEEKFGSSTVRLKEMRYNNSNLCPALKPVLEDLAATWPNSFTIIVKPDGYFLDACGLLWQVTWFPATPYSYQYAVPLSYTSDMMYTALSNGALIISDWHRYVNHLAVLLNIQTKNLQRTASVEKCGTDSPYLLANGNQNAEVCTDPYGFVCGNFKETRGSESRRTQFPMIDLESTVVKYLESDEESSSESIKYAKQLYRSCINTLENSTKAILDLWEMKEMEHLDWPLVDQKKVDYTSNTLPNFAFHSDFIKTCQEACESDFNSRTCIQKKEILFVTICLSVTKIARIVGINLDIPRMKAELRCLIYLLTKKNLEHNLPEMRSNCKNHADIDFFTIFLKDINWVISFELLRPFFGNDFRAYKAGKGGAIEVMETPQSSHVCYLAVRQMVDAHDAIYIQKMKATDERLEERISYVKSLVNDVKLETLRYIKEKWSDENVRQKVEQYLTDLKIFIGYDKKSLNNRALDESYAQILNNKNDNFFMNLVQLARFHEKNVPDVRQITFAAYTDKKHSIYVPYTSMIEPFFTFGRSESVNMGSLGLVIAHEFAHAVHHSLFTLGVTSSDSFTTFTDCLVSAYDKIQVTPNVFVNGTKTLAENMADFIGHRIAFKALKRRSKLVNEQDFFLASAWLFCQAPVSSAEQIQTSRRDEHTPGQHRVNEMLGQSNYFNSVFNCARKDTCEIYNT